MAIEGEREGERYREREGGRGGRGRESDIEIERGTEKERVGGVAVKITLRTGQKTKMTSSVGHI